ncbi:MAG: Sec-independent protein translocase protein TatB [Rhodospirillaceae bacterium]|nr:Sec-independent protein translocase protein TatB [Rhodospirillaceae bacterium]
MSWWEISIVGLMMILVLGPKELPHAMRTIARYMRKARRLASEFQGHMDDLVREADLDEVRKTVTSIKNQDVGSVIGQAVDPTGDLTREIDTTLADAREQVKEIKLEAGPTPTAAPARTSPAASKVEASKTDAPKVEPNSDASAAVGKA